MSKDHCKLCQPLDEHAATQFTSLLTDFFSTQNKTHDDPPIRDHEDYELNWTPDWEPAHQFFQDVFIPFRLPVAVREVPFQEEDLKELEDERIMNSKRSSNLLEESISFSELQLNSGFRSNVSKKFYETLGRKIMELRNKLSKSDNSDSWTPWNEGPDKQNLNDTRSDISKTIQNKPKKVKVLKINEILPVKLLQDPGEVNKYSQDIENLIEWQRVQMVRRDAKISQLSEQESYMESHLDGQVAKYTYTSDGKKIQIQEQNLPTQLPTAVSIIKYKEDPSAVVIKQPLPQVKIKALSRKVSMTSSQEDEEILSSIPEDKGEVKQQKIMDFIKLKSGVTYFERDKVKQGALTERNQISRSEYFKLKKYKDIQLFNTNTERSLSTLQQIDQSKLETINEDSRETSNLINTVEFINDFSSSRIYRTLNQNEVSELLVVPENNYTQNQRKSSLQNLFQNYQRNNQDCLSFPNLIPFDYMKDSSRITKPSQESILGPLTERNSQKSVHLLPKISKFAPRRQKISLIDKAMMQKSVSQSDLNKSRFPFIKQSRNVMLQSVTSLDKPNSKEQLKLWLSQQGFAQ